MKTTPRVSIQIFSLNNMFRLGVQSFRQKRLHSRILARAVELGYNPAKIKPIYDGVTDWDGYLKAPLKVC